MHVQSIRTFLEYYDVDISDKKFKRRCRLPKVYREDEEALTAQIIQKMAMNCHNRRLKPYILCLASGGFRARELLAARVSDVNLNTRPATIKVRKEYAKTNKARYSFISDETAAAIKQWLDYKYRVKRDKRDQRVQNTNDLVFTKNQNYGEKVVSPHTVYQKINLEFNKLQDDIGLSERKDGSLRRKYTLHSFRRFVKTVMETNVSASYSEWLLGHTKSSYWVKTPEEKAAEYLKIMKYVTFLDVTTIEATGKSYEAKLAEKDKQITDLQNQMKQMEASRENIADEVQEKILKMMEQPDSPFQKLLETKFQQGVLTGKNEQVKDQNKWMKEQLEIVGG